MNQPEMATCGLVRGVPLLTFCQQSGRKEDSIIRSMASSPLSCGIIYGWQVPNQRGRPGLSVQVIWVFICLFKFTKHEKTRESYISTHTLPIHKKGKVVCPDVFSLQYCVVFYFHSSRARKFRIGHLVQNIIIFWYCVYNNISQGKRILHLGAGAVTWGTASPQQYRVNKLEKARCWVKMQLFTPLAWPTEQGRKPLAKQDQISQKDMEGDTKSLTVSPAKIKEQKSQWPFLQRRAFPGLFPFKTDFFLAFKFRWLVFNKNLYKIKVFFFNLLFLNLGSFQQEIFRCLDLVGSSVIGF